MQLNTVSSALRDFDLIFGESISDNDERRERDLENAGVARNKRSDCATEPLDKEVREAGLSRGTEDAEVPAAGSWLKAWMFVSEQSKSYQSFIPTPSAPLKEYTLVSLLIFSRMLFSWRKMAAPVRLHFPTSLVRSFRGGAL